MDVQCDMTYGGWTLVGVAKTANSGQAGWNDEGWLNQVSSSSADQHWHMPSSIINTLATQDKFHAACFDSSNDYSRQWSGVTDYRWATVTSATSSSEWPSSTGSFPTSWAGHHYGLVSGSNEVTALITSHSGNQWACGGNAAPGGEGYTGRGGVSSFRLWAK